MALSRERIWFGVFAAYVAFLVVATIGELFSIDWILNIFDLKRIF